jgi:hypothetical protein
MRAKFKSCLFIVLTSSFIAFFILRVLINIRETLITSKGLLRSDCVLSMNSFPSILATNSTLLIIGDSVDFHFVRDFCIFHHGVLCSDSDPVCLRVLSNLCSGTCSEFEPWLSRSITLFHLCWIQQNNILLFHMYNYWGVVQDNDTMKFPRFDIVLSNSYAKSSHMRAQFILALRDMLRNITKQNPSFSVSIMFQSLFWDLYRHSTETNNEQIAIGSWVDSFSYNTSVFIENLRRVFSFADLWFFRNWNNISEVVPENLWHYRANGVIEAASNEAFSIAALHNMCLLDFHRFSHVLTDLHHPSENSSLIAMNALMQKIEGLKISK